MTTPKTVARGWWLQVANELLDMAIAAIPTTDPNLPGSWAMTAAVLGRMRGWSDPRVADWFAHAASLKQPCGGYGINQSYDQYADGSVNPPDTPYLITTATVGNLQLEGYRNGVVPLTELASTMDAVRYWINTDWNYGGSLGHIALPDYSEQPNGQAGNDHNKPQIFNCAASAAGFLKHAAAQIPPDDATSNRKADSDYKGTLWINRVKSLMNWPSNVGGWIYQSDSASLGRQDSAHNAVIVDELNDWLDTLVGQTQLAAGFKYNYVPGDLRAGSADATEFTYLAGAVRLLKYAYANVYVDPLFGRVVATIPAGGTDAGGLAAAAGNFYNTHAAWS